jgi:hypothetical protein
MNNELRICKCLNRRIESIQIVPIQSHDVIIQKASGSNPVNQSPLTDLLLPITTIISFKYGLTCMQQANLVFEA